MITDTPSGHDGFSADNELALRRDACGLLTLVGKKLRLPQRALGTAAALFHRFYAKHSIMRFDPLTMTGACLFLASKAEECPLKTSQVLELYHQRTEQPFDAQSDAAQQKRAELYTLEEMLLDSCEYTFSMLHPHEFVFAILKRCFGSRVVKDPKLKELAASAWKLIEDSYRTPLALSFRAQDIAVVAVHMAASAAKITIPPISGEDGVQIPWFESLSNLDLASMQAMAKLIADSGGSSATVNGMFHNLIGSVCVPVFADLCSFAESKASPSLDPARLLTGSATSSSSLSMSAGSGSVVSTSGSSASLQSSTAHVNGDSEGKDSRDKSKSKASASRSPERGNRAPRRSPSESPVMERSKRNASPTKSSDRNRSDSRGRPPDSARRRHSRSRSRSRSRGRRRSPPPRSRSGSRSRHSPPRGRDRYASRDYRNRNMPQQRWRNNRSSGYARGKSPPRRRSRSRSRSPARSPQRSRSSSRSRSDKQRKDDASDNGTRNGSTSDSRDEFGRDLPS